MITLERDAIDEVCALLDEYEQYLSGKAEGTTAVYLRTVRHLIGWLAQHPKVAPITASATVRHSTHASGVLERLWGPVLRCLCLAPRALLALWDNQGAYASCQSST